LFKKISKSYFNYHAFLTCFIVVFVISEKFASDLGRSLVFSWPETQDAIVRVPEHDLGFLLNGKIGPRD
jgi:hypothetical protein